MGGGPSTVEWMMDDDSTRGCSLSPPSIPSALSPPPGLVRAAVCVPSAPHVLLTFVCVCSIRSNPLRRDLPAFGGTSQQMPLLTSGSGLRPSSFLCPCVHGAEGPAERTRYACCHLMVAGNRGVRRAGGGMWSPPLRSALSNDGFCLKLPYACKQYH